jgi:hypothetical protein
MLSTAFKPAAHATPGLLMKEREYRDQYAHLIKESMVFETMLKPLGDMTAGCKIGIRYADRTLYVDKPSIFQGIVRWAYSQTRDKIREYIDTEILDTRGGASFTSLVYDLWIASGEIIDYCSAPSRGFVPSNDVRVAYRNLCAVNVNLLTRISHGLSMIAQSYSDSDSATARYSYDIVEYIETVLKRLKIDRLRLEFHIAQFAHYIK